MVRRMVGFLVLGLVSVAAADCSHEQKPPVAKPNAVTRAPAPTPRQPLAAAPAVRETSKAKEDPAIFFAFDSAVLPDDAHPLLQQAAEKVKDRSSAQVRIEGNCDQLGTVEYNLALGEHRARAARDYLVHLGVPRDRIATISYGSQRPKYGGGDDDARAKNRRDDVLVR